MTDDQFKEFMSLMTEIKDVLDVRLSAIERTLHEVSEAIHGDEIPLREKKPPKPLR